MYAHLIDVFGNPNKPFACVSDSYNLEAAVRDLWGTELHDKIVEKKALVAIRPDSGDPCTQVMMCLNILQEKFGFTTNSKGYKVLNNMRVVQGDGITGEVIEQILSTMLREGFSPTNIGTFGSGKEILQAVDRDTNRSAIKCDAVLINGEWRDAFKDPVTDQSKKSLRGRQGVVSELGEYKAKRLDAIPEGKDAMRTVWKNGELLIDEDFETMRSRA